ncbi:hypothetical protein BBJ29_001796 [Phytophthora kernoviae]|uniref:WRKY19-like zinc finger domain-containing protein n=1 Tax=Phytophthora kernoviae TaxID=325452 RepID=A0A3F2RQU1_9STRA|nr:hypothetical protein BBJ29_001796 [Phytophthora kernoviae]RLN62394.1 hypothetical protein BBP00_00004781 [Phytophthora kernoviae]
MFDPRRHFPDSPVDSAMFPPVYNRSSSASSTASSCPDNSLHDKGIAKPIQMAPLFKQETVNALEPFEFRPNPTPTMQSTTPIPVSTSLSSVFGDQDLIDAIMFSLNVEHGANTATPSPRFVVPRIQQVQVHTPQTFGAMLHQANSAPILNSRMKAPLATGPCIRKPGTFLNKDGRWIKGKPCRMEGCDKRAQSNGLCKGHGGGARCSFAGCSKSSQGGGFCRAHGGGKRCMHEGVEGCDKKDRGNGKCFSHGGGRKCQAQMCLNTIRRGAFCDLHNSK